MLFKSKFESGFVKPRPLKVAQELRRILLSIFGQDDFYGFSGTEKPRLAVTYVDVSPCLKYAKFFVTNYGDLDKDSVINYLESRKKEFRFILAQQIKLKFVPEISFHYDSTDEKAAALDAVFSKVAKL